MATFLRRRARTWMAWVDAGCEPALFQCQRGETFTAHHGDLDDLDQDFYPFCWLPISSTFQSFYSRPVGSKPTWYLRLWTFAHFDINLLKLINSHFPCAEHSFMHLRLPLRWTAFTGTCLTTRAGAFRAKNIQNSQRQRVAQIISWDVPNPWCSAWSVQDIYIGEYLGHGANVVSGWSLEGRHPDRTQQVDPWPRALWRWRKRFCLFFIWKLFHAYLLLCIVSPGCAGKSFQSLLFKLFLDLVLQLGNASGILQQRDAGSYTADEMRSIVAYAKSLHIEIIPEIDSPGHIQVLGGVLQKYDAISSC